MRTRRARDTPAARNSARCAATARPYGPRRGRGRGRHPGAARCTRSARYGRSAAARRRPRPASCAGWVRRRSARARGRDRQAAVQGRAHCRAAPAQSRRARRKPPRSPPRQLRMAARCVMMVARWRVRWVARSRTRFLLLSFHGGAMGLETIKTRAMAAQPTPLRSALHAPRALTRTCDFSTMLAMASTGAPPPPRGEDESDPLAPDAQPPESVRPDADVRIGLDRILPELIRRGLEAGRGPLSRAGESIFPKELASHLVSQLGDIRSGVVKAVAQEVGRFLREADIASEVRKVLTGLDIDAQVKLRFTARDDERSSHEPRCTSAASPRPHGPRSQKRRRSRVLRGLGAGGCTARPWRRDAGHRR